MTDHKAHSNIFSGHEMGSVLNDALKQGFEESKGADVHTKRKFFGMEVEGPLGVAIDSAWNLASSQVMKKLQPKSEQISRAITSKAGLSASTSNRIAASVVLGLNSAVVGSRYIIKAAQDHKQHFTDRTERARKLAPVLDELIGSHSAISYMRVKRDPKDGGNEMIFADRHRLNKIADTQNANNYLLIGINIAPTVAENLPGAKKMWAGKTEQAVEAAKSKTTTAAAAADVAKADTSTNNVVDTLGVVGQGLAGPLAESVITANQKKLSKSLQACSALDMVLNLQEQVAYDPKSKSFQLPKQAGGQSLGLEEYIVRVMIQHQKDMADISPDHSELREALKEDMLAAAKPIADAMRKGRIDALSLVRLIGEQKVIKNHGRAIADADDVLAQIEKLSGAERGPSMDAKEFFANTSFSKDELKTALKSLDDGEEKQRLMALVPNEVLKEVGYSEKEITAVREAMKGHYDSILSNAVLGIAANDDETLKQDGMPQSQRRQVQKLAAEINKDGSEAIVTSKNGTAHALDAERLVLDHVVSKVVTNPQYLSTLVDKGKSYSAANENHTNDNERSFAEREERRTASHAEREV